MLFNSVEFLIFLPVVFAIYWFVVAGHVRLQNAFVIAASYFFYGYWDYRFLALIVLSSAVDYFVGLQMKRAETERRRKLLLYFSVAVNIGVLFTFKYFGFFSDSLISLLHRIGIHTDMGSLHIILPVGISFYTFQTLSYTIDTYRRKIEPTSDALAFFAFVSFFPQLVAGPIERASHLLPQFQVHRRFDYGQAVDGLRQMLWGMFKKVVIADNCARIVNPVFANYGDYSGSTLLLAIFLFAFQIYGDFSGYSDIAIGTSRLFGIELNRNFRYPYFSRDIAEFWRRWHISLSTWFRDYVYIPLGGSAGNRLQKIRNVLVIFLLSGLWHGANWTFVVWGGLNALYFIPLLLLTRNRVNTDDLSISGPGEAVRSIAQILTTFSLTLIAWVFFRSATVGDAVGYLRILFSRSLFTVPAMFDRRTAVTIVLIGILVAVEWVHRDKPHGLDIGNTVRVPVVRWAIYSLVVFAIFGFPGHQEAFIYFQF